MTSTPLSSGPTSGSSGRHPSAIIQEVSRIPKVPVSYTIWMRLVTQLRDDSALEDVVAIIREDPGLVVKLIALANGACYNGNATIATAEQAVMRIGSNEVIRLVAMMAFRDTAASGLPLYGITQAEFTSLCVLTGTLMGGLAQSCEMQPGEAYTLGMIRGLGHWFIQTSLQAQNISVAPYHGPYMDAYRWEEATMQINHGEYGALAMHTFKLPRRILEPLSRYVRAENEQNSPANLLLRCTEHAASIILPSRTKPGFNPDWYRKFTSDSAFRKLTESAMRMASL